VTWVPVEIPSICVWIAPATPNVQRSELDVFIVGVIADAGGDFKVVVVLEFVFTVLSVIDSVLIVSSGTVVSVVVVSSAFAKTLKQKALINNKIRIHSTIYIVVLLYLYKKTEFTIWRKVLTKPNIGNIYLLRLF
jgi:hypothetical protein